MATHLARLMTIFLVIRGSLVAGSMCPCTRGCCEDGWIQYKDACYWAEVQHQKSWSHAEEYCVQQEAHLASVHGHEEDNFILHLMGNAKFSPYWLGAKRIRRGKDLHWTWTDHSPFQYERISRLSDPEEDQNHLTAMRWNDQGNIVWNYQDDRRSHVFICKYYLE